MHGPGEYRLDSSEVIATADGVPLPHLKRRTRNRKHAPCPRCGRSCSRRRTQARALHDLGNRETGRPVKIEFLFSIHRCPDCKKHFNIDLTDVADPGAMYTKRVVEKAVCYVVEDGSPYRDTSWQLWREHRVFVPFATIQNWVEAAGKKNRPEN